MIKEEKLKTMSQLALYEKKKSRKDLNMYSYDRDDYVRFEVLKTVILVVIAAAVLAAIVVLWNLETLIKDFDVLNYMKIIAVAVIAVIALLVIYIFISSSKSKDDYNRAYPRVRRYGKRLKKMKRFYAEEDKQQRQFEKGQWRNG